MSQFEISAGEFSKRLSRPQGLLSNARIATYVRQQSRSCKMGGAKDEMMRLEDLENLGMSILAKSGAVKYCEVHGYPIDQQDSQAVKDAYAIGNSMISRGEIMQDRKELSAAIKSASENAYWECPGCGSNDDD